MMLLLKFLNYQPWILSIQNCLNILMGLSRRRRPWGLAPGTTMRWSWLSRGNSVHTWLSRKASKGQSYTMWYSTPGTCRTSGTRRGSARARWPWPFRTSSFLCTMTMAVCVTLKMNKKRIYSVRGIHCKTSRNHDEWFFRLSTLSLWSSQRWALRQDARIKGAQPVVRTP